MFNLGNGYWQTMNYEVDIEVFEGRLKGVGLGERSNKE